MKKSLSLLVAIAMVFSMFATVVSAAPAEGQSAGEYLKELGVIQGDENGNLNEEGTLKRQDAVVLVARLVLGLEAAEALAGAEAEHDFTDVRGDYYNAVIAWAAEEGLVVGQTLTTFGFDAEVKAQELATILFRALGYTVGTEEGVDIPYADVVAAAIEAGLLPEGTENGDLPVRGGIYEILVGALELEDADGVKLGTKLGLPGYEVTDLAVSAFAAAGAKKLSVKFNKAVDTELTFSVKRDLVNVNVADVEWNEAKTEATLIASFNLQTGKHTVTVKGEEVDLSAEAEVTAAKVTKIEFPSEVGIITEGIVGAPDDRQGLRVNTKFYNQYGEDVTASVNLADLSITSSKGTATTFDKGALKIVDGLVENVANDFVVDQKVVVTIVHKPSTTVQTATLTVVQSAAVASIELGELTTNNEDLKGKVINVNRLNDNVTEYFIPVVAKDQYGNVLSAADLAGLTILTSNANILNAKSVITEVGGKSVLQFDAAPGTATNGIVVITLVAPNGTNKSGNYEVIANAKVDTLTISQPEVQLKKGVKTKLPFTAVDQFGNALVSSSELVLDTIAAGQLKLVDGTIINVAGATIHYDIEYANKNTVVISITPNADTVVLNVITANYKVQHLTLSAAATPAPHAIKGLNGDRYTLIQQGRTSNVPVGKIDLLDQYGEGISLPAGWSIKVEAVDNNFDLVSIGGGTSATLTNAAGQEVNFTASTTLKGVEQVKFTLINSDADVVDEYVTGIESVELGAISTFQLAAIDKVYTGGDITPNAGYQFAITDYDRGITLEGLKGGKKVLVDQNLMKGATISAGAPAVDFANKKVLAPSTAIGTDGNDREATLSVVVETANGAQTLTQKVVYNSAAPVATTINVKKGGDVVNAPVVEISAGTALDDKDISAIAVDPDERAAVFFEVKDQYGKDFELNNKYIITAKDSPATIAVTDAGILSVTGGAIVAGNSFQITLITPNGLTKTIKIIFGA